jgi:protein-disulfide isomerase
MPARLERLANVILIVATVFSCLVLVRREFRQAPTNQTSLTSAEEPRYDELKKIGRTSGNLTAQMNIMVLADFECPACRSFDRVLRPFLARHRNDVSYSFVHYPLDYHRFAATAAMAAECAGGQGRFEEMHNALFDGQDSLSTADFSTMAIHVGIDDTTAFRLCIESNNVPARITDGIALGDAMRVQGTPTVLINGRRLSRPPSSAQLGSAFQSIKTP